MKKFKKIANIISAVIIAIGLFGAIYTYADHAVNCHGCSSHYMHPVFELMYFGIIVLFAAVFFFISRLIIWLVNNRNNPQSISELRIVKAKRTANSLTLAVLSVGFVHVMIVFIKEIIEYIIYLDRLLVGNAALNFVLLIPYALAALLIFGIGEIIVLVIKKGEREQEKLT